MLKNYQDDLIRHLDQQLNLCKWGFVPSYRSDKSIYVIFNSEWCRLKVTYRREYNSENEELYFHYGRLHALNEQPYIYVDNEPFYCWHRSDFLCLFFLDNYKIEEVKSDFELVPIVDEYWKSKEGTTLRNKGTKDFSSQKEKIIWDNYAPRLFELYDLRKPDLWKKYQEFVKRFYLSQNWKPKSNMFGRTAPPPPWMIC